MPIYEYECQKCNTRLEVFQKINDKPPTRHQKCGGKWERLISAPAIQFKGDGWYVTDYAKATKKETAESEPTTEKKAEKKKESSPAKKSSDKSSHSKPSD
jgi:putative FmdB family regulatory protein